MLGSYDNNLYAIDATNGSLKWKCTIGKYMWRFPVGDYVRSSPAVAGGMADVSSAYGNLYAIDAITGNLEWKYSTGGFAGSSPAISKGMVYIGSADNTIYSFSQENAIPIQQTLLSNIASSPEATSGAGAVGTTLILASA